jgi:hypothetical protein
MMIAAGPLPSGKSYPRQRAGRGAGARPVCGPAVPSAMFSRSSRNRCRPLVAMQNRLAPFLFALPRDHPPQESADTPRLLVVH